MIKFVSIIKYSLFPRRCAICGEVVSMDKAFCPRCINAKRIEGVICKDCGKNKKDCDCQKHHHKPAYNAIVAPFVADNEIILPAVHRLKFFGRKDMAYPMAHQISDVVKERLGDITFDYVTCVPIAKQRLRKRGYNQSELLAKIVAKDLGLKYVPTLKKLFNTKPQRKMSLKYRRGNVYGAFDIIDDLDVENKCILIVDDIKTTGSTISHCADILKMYGAKSVYATTFGIR